MADILAIGLNAKPKTRSVPVCLDGDIEDELAEMRKRLLEAQAQDEGSFSGGRAKKVLADIQGLQKRAVAKSLTFHLCKLPPLRPLDLQAAHPPREGNEADANHGFNRESYFPALVRECCYEVSHPDGTVLAAEELTDEWWTNIFTTVNHAQFDELFSAAYSINHRDSAAPFLRAASQTSQTSSGDSEPPATGEDQAPSGSLDGSPAPEPSTPTATTGDFSNP